MFSTNNNNQRKGQHNSSCFRTPPAWGSQRGKMALESFAGRRVSIVVLGACTVLAACASIGPKHRTALTAEAALQVAAEAEAAGNNELAMSMYAEAAAREPGNVELQLRCADALARSGKISQTRQLITERLHARPGDPELMRALALID